MSIVVPPAVPSPADLLEGHLLDSGWVVGNRIYKRIGATGANFGVCYLATRDEEVAFVKAVDFRRAFSEDDLLSAIGELASWAQWEKEVMEYCGEHGLSKIVRLLNHEYVTLPADRGDPTRRISCLVLEIGKGDLRSELDIAKSPRDSWRLHVLRDVALAVDQLHRKGIAHLDIKPSNVIAMASGAKPQMKLGDMGRVVRKGTAGPFDSELWPGDPQYRPPEKLYGYRCGQWNDERESADAFLLGNLLIFLFTGVPMSTLLWQRTPQPFRPETYRGAFDQELLDVLVRAQAEVLEVYLRPALHIECADELLAAALELTHPDPTKRGDRRARRQGIVGMDRYHQRFLNLATKMERIERAANR